MIIGILLFNVPQGYSKYLISSFGISDKNVREWEISSRGMQETSFANTASFVSYARNVKSGDLLASKSLYVSAQADTDGIDRSVLKNNLKKVTSSFKKLNVNNQTDIKSFVEDNGLPFAKGCAFYELTKREIIQPTKDIVIQDTNNDLYTGNDARNLLGIPTNVYSKVTPADHNSYKIFVKSTSSNRILKSGTQLLYKV